MLQISLVMLAAQAHPANVEIWFIDAGAAWVAAGVPGARRQVLAGQGHDVSIEAIAPVIAEFFFGRTDPFKRV